METTGQVYSYYFTRECCPQIVLLILWALALLLIPVQLMLNRSHKVQRHCITQFLIENVFSIMLNKRIDRDGKEVCTILNYRVPDVGAVLKLQGPDVGYGAHSHGSCVGAVLGYFSLPRNTQLQH